MTRMKFIPNRRRGSGDGSHLSDMLIEANGYHLDMLNNVRFFDDFIVDTLNGDNWASAVEADVTDQSAIAIAEAQGGTLTLSLGSTANDFATLASPIAFLSGKAGRLDVRIRATGSTHAPDSIFVGLSDAKTESNGVIVSNLGTLAAAPTDGMGFAYELANGGDSWYGVGIKNDVDKSVSLNTALGTAYQKLSMTWDGAGEVRFYINDVEKGRLLDAYDNDHTLCVLISSTHIGGTGDPVLTVDYVSLVQER